MANYDTTTIKCENEEVIRSMVKNGEIELPIVDGGYGWCDTIAIGEDFKSCTIETKNGVPIVNLEALSAKFKDSLIICHFTLEETRRTETDIVEIMNGELKQVGIEINYMYSGDVNELPENIREIVYEKLENFYRQIDKVIDFKVCYCEGEVAWTFEYDKYKIEAKKTDCEIDTKVFEKKEVLKTEWIPLESECMFI